jgi:D-alanyl-D-alanine carboxypeptidase
MLMRLSALPKNAFKSMFPPCPPCASFPANHKSGRPNGHRQRQTRGRTVTNGRGCIARIGLLISVFFFLAGTAVAAPYASIVVDARSGQVLSETNADTRLHPASLTKMMTLYIAFEAIENGEISLDTRVRISRHAASRPPSKLGMREGQQIALRHLIRAAAIKSANDAATAIAEAIEGSEEAFARRMNRTAQALGMTRSTFRNAHGLTQEGHLSTARDMNTLGRHMFFDYPAYYNLFSRITTDAGVAEVANTNRRFLQSYKGADGIKTGYTVAAGFNLTASAERGGKRLIGTIFGGNSTATRNSHMAELLDRGFRAAPDRVAVRAPGRPPYMGRIGNTPAVTPSAPVAVAAVVISRSIRPVPRPAGRVPAPSEDVLIALQTGIDQTLAQLNAAEAAPQAAPAPQTADAAVVEVAVAAALPELAPRPRPAEEEVVLVSAPATAAAPEPEPAQREVVARLSTSGGRHWGINVGRFNTRTQAERTLLQTALMELSTLDSALRKVVQTPRGFDANFVGMSQEEADLACRRLAARSLPCETLNPG